jgi:hypothetical protein
MIARYQKSDKIRGTLLIADIQCPLTKVKAKSFRKINLACVEGKVPDRKKNNDKLKFQVTGLISMQL